MSDMEGISLFRKHLALLICDVNFCLYSGSVLQVLVWILLFDYMYKAVQ